MRYPARMRNTGYLDNKSYSNIQVKFSRSLKKLEREGLLNKHVLDLKRMRIFRIGAQYLNYGITDKGAQKCVQLAKYLREQSRKRSGRITRADIKEYLTL